MKYMITVLIALLLFSCKKNTTVSGKITSSADGHPVADVDVAIKFFFTGDGNVTKVTDSDEQKTDQNGRYMLEIKPKRNRSGGFTVHKEGFAPINPVKVNAGDNKEIDFVLNPYDAWLSVTFENTSATEDKKYYYHCTSDFLIQGFSKDQGGPFVLQPLASKTDLHLIPGGADILLKWDTVRITGQPLKMEVAIPCNRNVTNYRTVKI